MRPTKRTPAVEKRLLEVIKSGLPLKFATAAAGISYHTLAGWRNKDPKFAEAVEIARLASVEAQWQAIQKAAEDTDKGRGDWKALAWCLERSHPESFARPEIQLGIAIQNNVNVNGGGHTFETMVLSDLQFAKLRSNEAYSHHKPEQPANAREVEVSRVDPDLSGHLSRTDCPGRAVVSESQAAENQRRVERANAQIEELLAAKRAGNGQGTGQGTGNGSNANGAPPSRPSADAGDQPPVNALILAPITWPQGEPTAAWWSGFVAGSNDRLVEKAAAIFACRSVLRETLGPLVAQNTPIDFESELVTLRDVHAAIQDLTGPKGWPVLLRKGGRS